MLKTLRIVCAVALFTAFNLFFLGFADFPGALARVQLVPALIALNIGALVLWGVVTAIFGRLYCACVCPLGVLQDAALWVRRRFAKASFSARPARWRLSAPARRDVRRRRTSPSSASRPNAWKGTRPA